MDKKCTGCGEVKDASEFGKDARNINGLQSRCRTCDGKSCKRWRKNNLQKDKDWHHAYHSANRDSILEKKRDRYKANPTKVKEGVERWRKENPDKYREVKTKSRNNYNLKYPERFVARVAVTIAVRAGKLPRVKTLACRDCGGQASEYHHEFGYEKQNWLKVVPLCKVCHARVDKS